MTRDSSDDDRFADRFDVEGFAARRFSVPLASPLATASGSIDERTGFVVRVPYRGITGIGEATPLPGWTESLDACESALRRALTAAADGGHDAGLFELDTEDVPAARHGFATALLDAAARCDGRPLYRWLDDGRRCGRVPANATVGDGSNDETIEAATSAVADGFECLKLKVGARSVDADLDRVRAVRDAVGDDLTVRLDANESWNRKQARRAFDALASLDIGYVEQPLPATDLDGLADLRGGPVDVAVDESLVECRMADVLDAGAADAVVLKPMVLGGPGTAHTLAMRAREDGVEPVVTTTVDAVVARTAAVHVAAAIPDVAPCGVATGEMLADDVGPDPVQVASGAASVPQEPGLGLDPGEVRP